jgi:hypothetical protein
VPEAHEGLQGRLGSRAVRRSAGILATTLFLMQAMTPAAQEVTEPALKAAFLYHFARFTTWPADGLSSPSAPMTMCVLGDQAVGAALAQAVKHRQVAGHAIRVVQLGAGESAGACQVLYLSGLPAARIAGVVATVREVPVLTVSDSATFLKAGGIAQFHFQKGQLRFVLAADAASRAGLQLSSRILILSKKPTENP